MPLDVKEIVAGCVAFLSPDILLDNGAECYCPSFAVQGPHPFVCVDSNSERSIWTPLSSKPGAPGGHPRYLIPQEHKRGGSNKWMTTDNYLIHPRQVWRGPHAAFVAASRQDYAENGGRNFLSPEGVGAIIGQIRTYGGWSSIEDNRPPMPSVDREDWFPGVASPVPGVPIMSLPSDRTIAIPSEPPEEMRYVEATYLACSRVVAAMELSKRRQRQAEREALENQLRALYEADGVPVPSNLRRSVTGAGATAREPVEDERRRADLLTPLLRFLLDGRKTKEQIVDYLTPLSYAKVNPRQMVENSIFHIDSGALKKGRIRECGRNEYEITDAGRAYLAYKGAALVQ